MTQGKRIAVGVLIVAILASLGISFLIFRQQAIESDNFMHLTVLTDGTVIVPFGDDLLVVQPDGLQRVIPLSRFGLEREVGRLAPVSGRQFLALREYRASVRLPDLLHCDLDMQSCEVRGRLNAGPEWASRLYSFPALGRVMMVDNAAHKVVLLDESGASKASLSGFRFPNGVFVSEKQAYLADTNHHRIVLLDVTPDGLRRASEYPVHKSGPHTWPVELGRLPDGRWLVQVAGDQMGDDRLQIYSKDWAFEYQTDPFKGADMVSSALVGDTLWVGLDDRRLYSLSPPYDVPTALPAGAVASFLDQRATLYADSRRLADGFMWAVIVAFLISCVVAILLDGKNHQALKAERDREKLEATLGTKVGGQVDDGPVPHWRALKVMRPLSLLLAPSGFITMGLDGIDGLGMGAWVVVAVTAVLGVLLFAISSGILGTRLEISGGDLCVTDSYGRRARASANGIKANAANLLIGDIPVMVGQPQQRFYDGEIFESKVGPFLADAAPLTGADLLGAAWRGRHFAYLALWLLYGVTLVAGSAALIHEHLM